MKAINRFSMGDSKWSKVIVSIAQHKLSRDGPCRSKQRADIEPPAVRYRWWWWSFENWNEAGCQSADFRYNLITRLSTCLFFSSSSLSSSLLLSLPRKQIYIPALAISSVPDVVSIKIFKVFVRHRLLLFAGISLVK